MKVLLVEDDTQFATWLANALVVHHYCVDTIADGQAAWELLQNCDYSLLLLDVIVPQLDGISLCRRLRAAGRTLPILLLTAKDKIDDRLAGLEAGADDYVIKPFDLSELLARMRALLRRSGAVVRNCLTWGQLQLNSDTGEVLYGAKALHLTPKEYQLLELFLRYPQRIFSRSTLLDRVWTVDDFPGEAAVTTQIKGLRQKLKAAGMTAEPIETLYGLGYRLKGLSPSIAKAESAEPAADAAAKSGAPESARKAHLMTVLAGMRESFKVGVAKDFTLLERTIAHIGQGTATEAMLRQAKVTAHRLIGSMGTFGFATGSEAAREIEQLLHHTADPDRLLALVDLLRQAIDPASRSTDGSTDCSIDCSGRSDRPIRLLIMADDTVATALLKTEHPWQVTVVDSVETAQAVLTAGTDILLLDLDFFPTPPQGLEALAKLTAYASTVPAITIATQNQLSDRVAAARLGGQCFLQKPIAPDTVWQAVTQVLQLTQAVDAKVMIVDDDPHLLAQLQNLLHAWGLHSTTLDDPEQFWEVLERTVPDLLILDVEMPEFDGIALCQVVRSDPRWSRLPILFLSAHTDAEIMQRVFQSGADDYVAKPIAESELMARILNRLKRVPFHQKR